MQRRREANGNERNIPCPHKVSFQSFFDYYFRFGGGGVVVLELPCLFSLFSFLMINLFFFTGLQ